MAKKKITTSTSLPRPPVVAVLGHVDHGKTTLLDFIRKSNVVAGEAGGITQHIGAYQVKFNPSTTLRADGERSRTIKVQPFDYAQGKRSKIKDEEGIITFIDTPGHEAFAKMRARGVHVADIAILVVAANDGVMPQTIESINHIKEAGIPMIVAPNKIDLPEADLDKVKQQLAKNGVLVEGFGGEVVVVPISAKTGQGVPQLLEMILLVAEMHGIKGDTTGKLIGVVIESKLDRFRGSLASVIVKQGTIKVGQTIYAEKITAKVKAMADSWGKPVSLALPSMPVEIMGWTFIPSIGALVQDELPSSVLTESTKSTSHYKLALPPIEQLKKINIILKTDVAGTLEAITSQLNQAVEIVDSGSGSITESDVLLAKSTRAFIVGFNVQATSAAKSLAEIEGVQIKIYKVIYQLLDEAAEVVELLNRPDTEEVLGEAQVITEFRLGDDRVAGCKVVKGRIALSDTVKLIRQQKEIAQTKIKSLRQGKVDVKKVDIDQECGLTCDKKLDFRPDDRIISYKKLKLFSD